MENAQPLRNKANQLISLLIKNALEPLAEKHLALQADTVILTSNNPRGETPGNIIADIVAGYPDELLAFNASQAYKTGFLHDPGRIPMEALEFSWQNCFE